MKKSFAVLLSILLSWALNSFAEDNLNVLKSDIISFSMDPHLSIAPIDGIIIVKEEHISIFINKIGLGCMAINCKQNIAVKQIFKASMAEIYQDECANNHYKAYESDALANDQDIYIEVIDYSKNICPIFISNWPTEIILKTIKGKNGSSEKFETKSKMKAELLIEKN